MSAIKGTRGTPNLKSAGPTLHHISATKLWIMEIERENLFEKIHRIYVLEEDFARQVQP